MNDPFGIFSNQNAQFFSGMPLLDIPVAVPDSTGIIDVGANLSGITALSTSGLTDFIPAGALSGNFSDLIASAGNPTTDFSQAFATVPVVNETFTNPFPVENFSSPLFVVPAENNEVAVFNTGALGFEVLPSPGTVTEAETVPEPSGAFAILFLVLLMFRLLRRNPTNTRKSPC